MGGWDRCRLPDGQQLHGWSRPASGMPTSTEPVLFCPEAWEHQVNGGIEDMARVFSVA
jgi:hypothetical protein